MVYIARYSRPVEVPGHWTALPFRYSFTTEVFAKCVAILADSLQSYHPEFIVVQHAITKYRRKILLLEHFSSAKTYQTRPPLSTYSHFHFSLHPIHLFFQFGFSTLLSETYMSDGSQSSRATTSRRGCRSEATRELNLNQK